VLCLDWTLVWNQRQWHRVLTEYLRHDNTVRPHRSLDLQPPRPAPRLALVEPDPVVSQVRRVDVLGGLIHEYRCAAECGDHGAGPGPFPDLMPFVP
jgi:hypothetical protein